MSAVVALSCSQLSCGYDAQPVLHDISFKLNSGSVTALLGVNGSGKSTLLKTLSKSIPLLSGECTVYGEELNSLSHQKLAGLVGFVPQDEVPQFGFTVREIVVMGRMPRSSSFFDSEEDHSVATRAMRLADCLQLENRPITEVSAGERQRTYIARALAQDAKIILLDEPTAHLDLKHQLEIGSLLSALAKQGYTIMSALHDLNLAIRFSDRVLVLDHGKIAIDTTSDQLPQHPELGKIYEVELAIVRGPEGGLLIVPKTRPAPSAVDE